MNLKHWVIRFVLGVVLGFGAGAIVIFLHLALVTVLFGGLTEYLDRKHPREEAWLHYLGLCAMTAAMYAAMAGGFFGVMLAPFHFTDRMVLRSWGIASGLAAIVGALVGAGLSLLHPQILGLGWAAVLSGGVGALGGIAGAVVLRLLVNK